MPSNYVAAAPVPDGSAALLAAIQKKIRDGKILTWTFDVRGNFIHTGDKQWIGQAWLKPDVTNDDVLMMKLLVPKGGLKKPAARGVYLGRWAEMLVNHFDMSIGVVEIGEM